jgi:hypothetical protein
MPRKYKYLTAFVSQTAASRSPQGNEIGIKSQFTLSCRVLDDEEIVGVMFRHARPSESFDTPA